MKDKHTQLEGTKEMTNNHLEDPNKATPSIQMSLPTPWES